jgi:hypothetical protein
MRTFPLWLVVAAMVIFAALVGIAWVIWEAAKWPYPL